MVHAFALRKLIEWRGTNESTKLILANEHQMIPLNDDDHTYNSLLTRKDISEICKIRG